MSSQNLVFTGSDISSGLAAMVSRLRGVIEEETKLISEDSTFDFKASSERKSRLLFELNRVTRTSDLSLLDDATLAELEKLKLALDKNAICIKAHLSAVHEVSDLMIGILKNENADGTYSELI